jgi:aspartate-semialdehyde dehydrogenase
MISSDLYFRDKIPVAILGVLSVKGQQFIQLLQGHPWFEIRVLYDEGHVGSTYRQSVHWQMKTFLPDLIGGMCIESYKNIPSSILVFSALQQEAQEIELLFTEAGCQVMIGDFRSGDVVSILAEVNAENISLDPETITAGGLFSSPHPISIGIGLACKPLVDLDLLNKVEVAVGESEERIFYEIQQLFKKMGGIKIIQIQTKEILKEQAKILFHFKKEIDSTQLLQIWNAFVSIPQELQLPSAPFFPLYVEPSEIHSFPTITNSSQRKYISVMSQLMGKGDHYSGMLTSQFIRNETRNVLLNGELLVQLGKIYW